MKHQILNRYDTRVQFELECESLKDCLITAVKGGANLYGANLRGANLYGANLGEKAGKLLPNGYFTAGPLGSRNDTLTAFHTDKGIFIRTGCFFDSLTLFRAAVVKTHGEESKHRKLYLSVCNFIEFKFAKEAS